jgi:tetratricopeptide (TPR) repeat protein
MAMKKITALVWIMVLTETVFGQQSVDIVMKARAFDSAGKPDQAVKVLTDAIALSGESSLYVERAEARINQRSYSDAISDLNEANKTVPFSGEYGLSRVYAFKGDAGTSLYHLEMNLNSPFRKTEKEIMLDPAFRMIENRSEWRQFWKKEWYSHTEKSISEIEYSVSSGRTEEARSILSDLRKNNENSDESIYAGALINLSSGRYNEAIKDITGLIASSPGNEKYLRILAKAQILTANPAGASVTYTQLFDAGVADPELLILRAECYRKTGEYDKALIDIERYLEMYPENKSALSLAGKIEAISGDNLKALDYFSKNLKLHPGDPECYVDRANSYFISKSWDWAIKDYSMSLDLNPANQDVWLNKGIALLNTNRIEDACHDLRKALSLGNKQASEYISSNCIK